MKRTLPVRILLVGAIVASSAWSSGPQASPTETLPKDAKLTALEVKPDKIELTNRFDYRQILVTAKLSGGEPIDATRMAEIKVPDNLIKISATGLVRPRADGSGAIAIALRGQSVNVPVTVKGQAETYNISFVRDVMPAISKMGCNAGTCHGAAKGKNGFQLSLRGYDPVFDHRALTDDHEGRRFDRSAPDRSMMLLKCSGEIPHVGGVLSSPGEPYYEMLRLWIGNGVKLDANAPKVATIELYPQAPVLSLAGSKQQMLVFATYSDGAVRDVTGEAFIEVSNIDTAKAESSGIVTALRRGEAGILARFEGAYAATSLVVMGDRTGFVWKQQPHFNWIDELVDKKLQRVKIEAAGAASDAEFLRRIYLDLTGLPPTGAEARAFLADSRPMKVKRDEVIEKLIGSPDFVEYWANKWSDLLQVNRKFLSERGAWTLRNWIRGAIENNLPYDQFVHTILTAQGSTFSNPPSSYMRVHREAVDAMENTTQVFLGIRFNCNKCHDHPFERWTQSQYYELASYFAQVGRKPGRQPEDEIVFDMKGGDIPNLRTGSTAEAKFPYSHADMPAGSSPRREQLAHWLSSKDNPYFAKSYVNRIWSYLLGVGLIEPVDDIRAGNPPSNPELLDRLTDEFIKCGFDTRHMMRLICSSRAYQSSMETTKWNEDDDVNFSHAIARRLPAEVLFDAIHRATGASVKLPGIPAGFRAIQLPDTAVKLPSGFLEIFGRPERESACECDRDNSVALAPVMTLINGPTIGDAVKDPANTLNKLVASEPDNRKVVEEVFLSILGRFPAEKEYAPALEAIDAGVKERSRLEGLVAEAEKTLSARQSAWESSQASATWSVLDLDELKSAGGATLTKLPDQSVLVSGPNPTPETYTFIASTSLDKVSAIRLEVLPDPSLPASGPGRAPNGNMVLNEFKVVARSKADKTMTKSATFAKARADFSQESWDVSGAIDGNESSGWAVSPQVGNPHFAVFQLREPVGFSGATVLSFTMEQKFPGRDHNIGRFRISATNAPNPVDSEALPEKVRAVIAIAAEKRTEEQKKSLAAFYRTIDPEYRRAADQLAANREAATDPRMIGVQDLAWALINSPAFLFNH